MMYVTKVDLLCHVCDLQMRCMLLYNREYISAILGWIWHTHWIYFDRNRKMHVHVLDRVDCT